MSTGFRVQSVSVEGFKGFTTRQEIDLGGRHVFLLGQNGNGKSSIIEAVRWALIGSTGRPNEVVDNRSYASACRVILSLMSGDRMYTLRRTSIRGISGGNDAVLTDERGQEHLLREVMPQLDSVDAGEGTYIIFSSQAAPPRRQPKDLTSFERTVLNHLGLTHPRSLLGGFDEVLVDQELIEQKLGQKLNDVREGLDSQISAIEGQRSLITISPPWKGNQPSRQQSEEKVRGFIAEVTGSPSDETLLGVSLDGLIDRADDALLGQQGQSALEDEARQVANRRGPLEELHRITIDIATKRDNAQNVRSQLVGVLNGSSPEELQGRITTKKEEEEARALRHRVIEDATRLVGHGDAQTVQCPVCESEHQKENLESALERSANLLAGDHAMELTALEDQFSNARKLQSVLEEHEKGLADLEEEAGRLRTDIDSTNDEELLPQGPASEDDLEEVIRLCEKREESIKAQIEQQEDWFKEMQARLSDLRREASFHALQASLTQILERRNRFDDVNRAYEDLVSFGESVRTIRRVAENCLNGKLEEGIPGVSENLSRVFHALTRHPWFDRLAIDTGKLPKLELLVASSQDSSEVGYPTDVLNGQAESALELVPNIAFSETDDAPTEVHAFMLDDPTRAFDEEHIAILVERLAELGRRVQLVVASQEASRFRELLPLYFRAGEYVIIEPTGWSYHNGPKLNIEYG